uniref:FERM domain-containing protein n=1 Tax=Heterorhabditis bacteriophora TaxID=37862 RepID=A0A1I7W748_HETBA
MERQIALCIKVGRSLNVNIIQTYKFIQSGYVYFAIHDDTGDIRFIARKWPMMSAANETLNTKRVKQKRGKEALNRMDGGERYGLPPDGAILLNV